MTDTQADLTERARAEELLKGLLHYGRGVPAWLQKTGPDYELDVARAVSALQSEREAAAAEARRQIDLVALENSIAERSKRFRTFDDRREHSRYMALALAGEVGELCNIVKKEWRGDPKGLNGAALLDEASDVFVYWTLFCHVHGWTIQRVMEHADKKAERKIVALEAERLASPPAPQEGTP